MGLPAAWRRAQPTNTESFRHCTPFTLPSLGVIEIAPGNTITLETDAVFTPQCPTTEQSQVNAEDSGGVTSITDMRDPFHASITPQAYATGAATVIAWMLVIMLIITPRTFFVGGPSGRSGLMGRRGMISGAQGGGSIIGVGTRPWLQKVAALTVAVSLTLATADTFEIAERQYNEGFMDAMQLRDEVVSGMEIKVSRVISDVFLWLAQVQTLIRLFPRHKEKVIIKWVGFALILLDITFSSLNSFGPYTEKRSPRHFETAIPALSYLFQLSLSMLYAAWVMYYAITKRRTAFYHPMMWNISLVALLSIVAILTPVVFFITDISNYTIAGWGDYFRWVGAAAASVIVWEWVERIEALEREERKDGILGREIYDGDEMLDTTPSHELNWPSMQRRGYMADDPKRSGDDGSGRGGGIFASGHAARLHSFAQKLSLSRRQLPKTEPHKKRTIHIPAPAPVHRRSQSAQRGERSSRAYAPLQSPRSPPPTVASPVSRTDTTSADSTVYAVRYHPISNTPPVPNQAVPIEERLQRVPSPDYEHAQDPHQSDTDIDPEKGIEIIEDTNASRDRRRWNWQAVVNVNPFRRRGRSPPPEVQRGRVIEPLGVEDVSLNIPQRNYTGLALKDRLGTFAAQQGERFRSKKKPPQGVEMNLPVTIIPAQPRGRTWSPEILQQQQQREEISTGEAVQVAIDAPSPAPLPTMDNDSSPAQADESNGSPPGEAPSTVPNRASRIRFTPETFQRPGARQNEQEMRAPSQPPSSVAQGPEIGDPAPETNITPQAPREHSSRPGSPEPQQQRPTNHDR
ncbi:PalH-domain-containing protein [Trematosphaeria pertusa]|uniref:PalH-domain-containing protein n=1 Tax=Trematosphaeria pertusa TaxID=390896 RepID=A0A6A6IPN1_9PLEO|nr:PalH-domain-containing protein [Trematosphaeria pertusa]KAF2252207.1 PalH-domain-containing protein [Trematosphaeria pertusa]